jgi:hypothetical protein
MDEVLAGVMMVALDYITPAGLLMYNIQRSFTTIEHAGVYYTIEVSPPVSMMKLQSLMFPHTHDHEGVPE